MHDLNVQAVDPLHDLEPLDVVWKDGSWRSVSDRRLWALKHSASAMAGQPLFVRVRVREFHARETSADDGVSVRIVTHVL